MIQRVSRVLIADDMPANRALLRAYLGRMGFETIMAEDGLQAVEMYISNNPDIVLMDIMMPRLDGFSAIRKIREIETDRWIPIVIVSAMDAELDIVRGLESGADDYLTKPLSYQIFSAKMRNLARTLEFQESRKDAMQREAAVADAMVDGVLIFDEGFRIVDSNKAACASFGINKVDIIGLDIRNLFSEESRLVFSSNFLNYVEGVFVGFGGNLHELYGKDGNGSVFPIEVCVTELKSSDSRLFILTARDISQRKKVENQLAENTARLQHYHDEAESEAELAKVIIDRHIRRDMLETCGVRYWVIPTQRFSGDIVLAARSNGGALYAMLADATGHGLAAAMSGLTIVNDFYHCVEHEVPIEKMVLDLNNSLHKLLPPGRFVSAALVCISKDGVSSGIWVGGIPDVIQLDASGRVIHRFSSSQLPLGITEMEEKDVCISALRFNENQQLLLYSDGVIEACSKGGEPFGYEGLEKSLIGPASDERLFDLMEALTDHLDGAPAHDDISMLLIDRERVWN